MFWSNFHNIDKLICEIMVVCSQSRPIQPHTKRFTETSEKRK
jgi:hypothetical protein